MSETRYSTSDVADYYNQTLVHYRQWWKLDQAFSLHYGLWFNGTKSFKEALTNTNKTMAEAAGVKEGDRVLDAGCGVGGAAMFLASEFNCNVDGITLSEKQVDFARQGVKRLGLGDLVTIKQMDYCNTDYPDNSFDIAWACESSSSAINTDDFANEMYRILKPGGKLVVADFFWPEPDMKDPNQYMKKWGDTWGIGKFEDIQAFNNHLTDAGFDISSQADYTNEVTPAAKKMYRAYQLGAPFSRLYNLAKGSKVSRFARTHYLCGKYQYLALKNGLWRYFLVVANKR